ncbi:hypothetical protein AAA435_11385 [Lactobacillus crispatus]|uniref:hypothetical protein n=2 Tax=Lactobacillus crispatus TaxID=47770 RepID=UPI0030FCD0CE
MAKMSKLGLAGSALLATAGGATTLASGLTITAHASEKPQTNTQTNQADKLKKASNQLDTASKQQAKMINALLESKVDAQVPTQPGTYTKSVALLDASGKQLGTATLTRVVNADGSSQSSLSKDIPAGYTLKDVSVLNHYPSAVTLTRVAGATQAGTTTKAIKLTDASGKLIANGTVTRVVDEKGASTVSVKGIPQGYRVADMDSLSTFPDQLVIEKGEAINSQTQQKTNEDQRENVAPVNSNESNTHLTTGGQSQQAGTTTAGNQNGTTTNTGADKGNTANTGNTTAGQGNQQTGNTTSGTTTGNTGSQSGQAQQGGTTSADQGKTDAGTTTNTGADTNKGQQTSDASKDSSKTSTDSKTTTDQGKTDTKKDDSKTSTSTTDSAKKDDTKKDDSKTSTAEKKDEAKKDDSKSDTSKTNDTNSKVDNAIKGIDSVAKSSTDATKSVDNKSSDTGKKDDSKKSDSSKSDDKRADDKKSDKKDGKLDLSDTTDALKKSSKDDDKKDSSAKKSNSDDSSKKDNVSNLLNKSANKSSNASDNAKVADADVSDNLSGKDGSTKKGITSSSTNATLPETDNTQSTAGILAGSAMVATMTVLGIGVAHRKRS